MKRQIPLCLIGCFTPIACLGNPDWVIIPFTLVNKIILIQAKVDNKSGWFVLDTGTVETQLAMHREKENANKK